MIVGPKAEVLYFTYNSQTLRCTGQSLHTNLYLPDLWQLCLQQGEENWNELPAREVRNFRILLLLQVQDTNLSLVQG